MLADQAAGKVIEWRFGGRFGTLCLLFPKRLIWLEELYIYQKNIMEFNFKYHKFIFIGILGLLCCHCSTTRKVRLPTANFADTLQQQELKIYAGKQLIVNKKLLQSIDEVKFSDSLNIYPLYKYLKQLPDSSNDIPSLYIDENVSYDILTKIAATCGYSGFKKIILMVEPISTSSNNLFGFTIDLPESPIKTDTSNLGLSILIRKDSLDFGSTNEAFYSLMEGKKFETQNISFDMLSNQFNDIRKYLTTMENPPSDVAIVNLISRRDVKYLKIIRLVEAAYFNGFKTIRLSILNE